MAESNKIYFDALPDVVILKIFGYLETLSDRSKMAQVSRRFNKLVNLRNWRRSIFITSEEFERFSISYSTRVSFVEAIMNEFKKSNQLEVLNIEIPEEDPTQCTFLSPFNDLFKMINDEIRKLDNFVGICTIRSSIHVIHMTAFFSPHDADNGRMIRYPPVSATSLEFEGNVTDKFEKILESSKESVREVKFQCPITVPFLRKLGECEKLENIILAGEVTLPPNAISPKIRSEIIVSLKPVSSEQSNQIQVMFTSNKLIVSYIPFSLVKGSEEEICLTSPNLKCIGVMMANEADVSVEVFKYSCDQLINSWQNNSQIHGLIFSFMTRRLDKILTDLTSDLRIAAVRERIGNSEPSFGLKLVRASQKWSFPPKILSPGKQDFFNCEYFKFLSN